MRETECKPPAAGPLDAARRPPGGVPGEDGRLLDSFKLKVYLTVLPLGALGALLSWSLWRPAGGVTALERLTDPALAALFAVLISVLMVGKERAVRHVERVGYWGVVAYFLADRYRVVYAGGLGDAPVDKISEVFSWTPVVYILAFLIFGERRGLAISCAFYALFLAGGLPHLWLGADRGGRSSEFLALVQFYLADAVVVVLLYAFACFTRAYLQAHALGEVARRMARTDFATGLPNRRHLYEALEAEIRSASRGGPPFALIIFDLDRFKRINDSFGHDAGDRVLEGVARLVDGQLRGPDQLSRWGGEEFLILAPGSDIEGGRATALRMKEAVAGLRLDGVDAVTASFGVAAHRARDTPETLLKRADDALYRAKAAGRNRVEVAVP